ncbi:heavy metal translocatin [Obba rivulosa]|uniref:Heavy metal translocatin n=1 Tax=Obba rivulosa TaxID=1052685 RepID=A0A8E2DVG6_9APHY|nr:heavy metal translocatin [Obba rivulosa]
MAGSCCKESEETSPAHLGIHVSASAAKSDLCGRESMMNGGERAQESIPCCETGGCKCDDSCLAQLARAICADDRTHQAEGGDNGQHAMSLACDSDSIISTCCGETANTPDQAGSGAKKHVFSSGDAVSKSACRDTGLRRRMTKHPGDGGDQAALPSKACGHHMSVAWARQKSTLAAFGCICKAMLAHGLQSCCTTSHAANKDDNISHIAPLNRSTLSVVSKKSGHSINTCADGCCGKSSVRPIQYDPTQKKAASTTSVAGSCGAGSCCVRSRGGSAIKPKDIIEIETCPQLKSRSCASVDSCCGDSCCGGSVRSRREIKSEEIPGISSDNDLAELEKGIGSPDKHAVLVIKGMTCTGCETKLTRVLHAIPAIRNIKTSLVMCRAEFDYDSGATDLQSLVPIIEKRSGFTAEVINAQTMRGLVLMVDRSLCEQFLLKSPPKGLDKVSRIQKGMVRIVYDPHIISARNVIQAYSEFTPVLAPEARDPAITAGAKHIHTLAARVVASSLLTIPVLVMAWAPLPKHPRAYNIASMVLATAVQTVITGPFYVHAFKSLLFSRLIETDLLVVLSTTAAYMYSVVAFAYEMIGRPLATGGFFETSTLLVTLIMLGKLISAFARQRAMEAISIRSLQQQSATLVHEDGHEETIDARLLGYGDHFMVLPDSTIITDGEVVTGQSEVDESMMTGEPILVAKQPGSAVTAGTLNGPSAMIIAATRLPGDNTISDIAALVDDARVSRARVQDTVDRVCAWFVPAVLAAAGSTFLIWLAVGIRVRGQPAGQAAVTALTYAIAVLAISCPCAIGLAVPMVVLVAGGVAARHGLVFKAAATVESARAISHVVFDKTGTLTQGRLAVVSSVFLDETNMDGRATIAGLVATSRHPVSRAIAAFLGSVDGAGYQIGNAKMITGNGIEATLAGGTLRGGSARWLQVEDHAAVRPISSSGLTAFCVTYNDDLIAVFGLEDTLRPEAASVLRNLRKRGISISLLSGDNAAAVDNVAQVLGIPQDHVRSACMPADKQAYLKALSAAGDKVLFCGDGTNDAVALAQADIGVHLHIGEGAGVAASTAADAVLIHPSLAGILTLLQLSDAVSRRITVNFVWCFVYNLVAILFAAGAFVDARIAPAYAGLGEIVSVLPVVLVAVHLRWYKVHV